MESHEDPAGSLEDPARPYEDPAGSLEDPNGSSEDPNGSSEDPAGRPPVAKTLKRTFLKKYEYVVFCFIYVVRSHGD